MLFARQHDFDPELLFDHYFAWVRFVVRFRNTAYTAWLLGLNRPERPLPCGRLLQVWDHAQTVSDHVLIYQAAVRTALVHEKFSSRLVELLAYDDLWAQPSDPVAAGDILISFAATLDSVPKIDDQIFIWNCYASFHGHHVKLDWREPNKGRPWTAAEAFVEETFKIRNFIITA